jgi:D-alanyl-D-alanine carboxypeptidase
VVYLKVTATDKSTLRLTEADGYTWLYENAHKYGFILRYPEGKEEVTGEQYNEGIFRYVGVAHATAMHELGMCYEEYLAALKSTYTVESPYQVICEDVETGDEMSYLIYYVAAATGDTTNVPVYAETAEDAIAISGNGTDGFVVAIKE